MFSRFFLGFLLLVALVIEMPAGSVQNFDGTKVTGAVSMETGQLIVTPNGSPPMKIDLAELRRVQFVDALPVEVYARGVLLRNGTRLTGPFTALTDPVVKFDRQKISLSGGEIAWVIYQPFLPSVIATAPLGKVGALLAGGDFFEGTIKSADEQTAKLLNPIFGPRTLAGNSKDLLALVLRDLRPSLAIFEVRTKDGSLFAADALTFDKSGVSLRHQLYDNLKIEAKDLLEIRAGSGRSQSLTSLPSPRVEPPPAAKAPPSFAINQTIAGAAFEVAGTTYEKGLESATGVATTWEVPGGFNLFTALIALPADLPPTQRWVFAVYADGRLITRSAPLTSADPPTPFRARIGLVRHISLRVESPTPAPASGSGLWLDPLLIRQ